jgi:hypothetical protein
MRDINCNSLTRGGKGENQQREHEQRENSSQLSQGATSGSSTKRSPQNHHH